MCLCTGLFTDAKACMLLSQQTRSDRKHAVIVFLPQRATNWNHDGFCRVAVEIVHMHQIIRYGNYQILYGDPYHFSIDHACISLTGMAEKRLLWQFYGEHCRLLHILGINVPSYVRREYPTATTAWYPVGLPDSGREFLTGKPSVQCRYIGIYWGWVFIDLNYRGKVKMNNGLNIIQDSKGPFDTINWIQQTVADNRYVRHDVLTFLSEMSALSYINTAWHLFYKEASEIHSSTWKKKMWNIFLLLSIILYHFCSFHFQFCKILTTKELQMNDRVIGKP